MWDAEAAIEVLDVVEAASPCEDGPSAAAMSIASHCDKLMRNPTKRNAERLALLCRWGTCETPEDAARRLRCFVVYYLPQYEKELAAEQAPKEKGRRDDNTANDCEQCDSSHLVAQWHMWIEHVTCFEMDQMGQVSSLILDALSEVFNAIFLLAGEVRILNWLRENVPYNVFGPPKGNYRRS